jgi:hypothetical protein
MFEWCFRSRLRAVLFGVVVAGLVAGLGSRVPTLGGFAIVLGVAAGLPVLAAASPNLDGEGYLAATTGRERATDAALTAVSGGAAGALAALAVSVLVGPLAPGLLGPPAPALLGTVVVVLVGQGVFFSRNREFLDVGPDADAESDPGTES